jgi:hypothetical protein
MGWTIGLGTVVTVILTWHAAKVCSRSYVCPVYQKWLIGTSSTVFVILYWSAWYAAAFYPSYEWWTVFIALTTVLFLIFLLGYFAGFELDACPSCRRWWSGVKQSELKLEDWTYRCLWKCKYCDAQWSTDEDRSPGQGF